MTATHWTLFEELTGPQRAELFIGERLGTNGRSAAICNAMCFATPAIVM